MKSTVIEVDELRKSYGRLKAVDGISFQVHPGEIFGLVGPNGAGKTTVVECLTGLRKFESGQVRVLGLDPLRQERELRMQTGIQLQQAALSDDMKVWEALDLFASFYSRQQDWRPVAETWGLAEKANSRFASLSGGQKQRLFIALALIHDPQLVVLDELTTGLDPQARRATWEMVERLRESGKTVLLVTHFMEEAERLCDRVAIIDHGRLIALDSPPALVRALEAESRVRFHAPAGFATDWLRGVPGVRSLERQNGDVVVSGTGALLAQVAASLASVGVMPADLRSEQASLEDVFLALTGRQLRSDS